MSWDNKIEWWVVKISEGSGSYLFQSIIPVLSFRQEYEVKCWSGQRLKPRPSYEQCTLRIQIQNVTARPTSCVVCNVACTFNSLVCEEIEWRSVRNIVLNTCIWWSYWVQETVQPNVCIVSRQAERRGVEWDRVNCKSIVSLPRNSWYDASQAVESSLFCLASVLSHKRTVLVVWIIYPRIMTFKVCCPWLLSVVSFKFRKWEHLALFMWHLTHASGVKIVFDFIGINSIYFTTILTYLEQELLHYGSHIFITDGKPVCDVLKSRFFLCFKRINGLILKGPQCLLSHGTFNPSWQTVDFKTRCGSHRVTWLCCPLLACNLRKVSLYSKMMFV
jgi:hypothetical protein